MTHPSDLPRRRWGWQEVVEDCDALSGYSVAAVVARLAARLCTEQVVVSDIVPALDVWGTDSSCCAMPTERVLEALEGYAQVDWGDFFLFAHESDAMDAMRGAPSAHQDWYPYWILHSQGVMRCVDDAYFYFYGTDEGLRSWVRATMRSMEFKDGALSELDFPR